MQLETEIKYLKLFKNDMQSESESKYLKLFNYRN